VAVLKLWLSLKLLDSLGQARHNWRTLSVLPLNFLNKKEEEMERLFTLIPKVLSDLKESLKLQKGTSLTLKKHLKTYDMREDIPFSIL
jgi:hypothetical protein